MRYYACMATIQIRDIPEDVHRTYRERAAAAGMSLQEYLRAELTRNAKLRTPDEIAAQVADRLNIEGPGGFSEQSSAGVVRADRHSR